MDTGKNEGPSELECLRTHLANKRTFLAFVRTTLTLVIAGLSFIEFFSMVVMRVIGGGFLLIGLILLIIGWYQFKKTRKTIEAESSAKN